MPDLDNIPREVGHRRLAAHATTDGRVAALRWRNDRHLMRHGGPHQILSGALHYFRVHPDLWRDRIRRLADLGLNTVDTYVAWNFHQPHELRSACFTGWRDIERFAGIVADEGLDLIVRPGPYICAEWSNGGLPSWLTRRGVALRSSEPAFTDAVEPWFDDLVPRLARLQAAVGGPLVAVQVENEFGSYGDDQQYLRWNHDALTARGISELLFTADGPTELMLDAGTLPGTLAAMTLGSRAVEARALQSRRRPGEPFLVAEYWNGWFDHWGEKHHVRAVDSAVASLRDIVADGGSVSIYMAHGGTNFGLWSGANEVDGVVQPTVTSYDSDAPVAEDGSLTPKFHAVRRALGATGEPRSCAGPTHLPARVLNLRHHTDLLPGLARSAGPITTRSRPLSFDELALDAGLVVHTAHPRLPAGRQVLTFDDLRDRAYVYLDGASVGVVTGPRGTLEVSGAGEVVRLDVVVESLGRVNYGPRLGMAKGLCGNVLVERRIVQGWQSAPVALAEWTTRTLQATQGSDPVRSTAGFACADLVVDTPADTFLALPGSTKGFVWVNGFLLGRYWEIGPQLTLYCPAPLLHAGRNRIDVLELERLGDRVELREVAELGPTEEYIEEL